MTEPQELHLSDDILAAARKLSAQHAARSRWANATDQERKKQGAMLGKARIKARKLKKTKAIKNIA